MRALGPSLPVAGALLNPTLELHDGNGSMIAADDDWRDNQQFAIQATGIPPKEDAEAAIVSTLAPGNYTVVVRVPTERIDSVSSLMSTPVRRIVSMT